MGGGAASFKPFSVTFPFFPIIVLILIASAELDDPKENRIPSLDDDNGASTSSPPPVSSSSSTGSSGHHESRKLKAFKPSTAVVMGVLTVAFSLTFLLLLYVKHCNSGNTFVADNADSNNPRGGERARSHERVNSGIDREVVQSLPVFRFGSLRGQRKGLDCAVCLNGFDDLEVLRLLPKCKHAFHVECVDTWLDAHSTCPLCRNKVDPEDVVQNAEEESSSEEDVERGRSHNNDNTSQQPGERDGEFLQIVLQGQGRNSAASSFRASLDSDNVSRVIGGRRRSTEHRLEHRIIVSRSPSSCGGVHQRWSNVEPSDFLYLTSDMIISAGGRSRTVVERNNRSVVGGEGIENGRGGVGNLRSVSEMTGMRRVLNRGRGREREGGGGGGRGEQEQRHEGVVSRWLAWISRSQSRGNDVP